VFPRWYWQCFSKRVLRSRYYITSSRRENLASLIEILGCHVIATARRPEALTDLASLGISTVLLDVNDQSSIDAAKAKVETLAGGKLDILVNNA